MIRYNILCNYQIEIMEQSAQPIKSNGMAELPQSDPQPQTSRSKQRQILHSLAASKAIKGGQCVISYNFEMGEESKHVTHNLLIGFGQDDAPKSKKQRKFNYNSLNREVNSDSTVIYNGKDYSFVNGELKMPKYQSLIKGNNKEKGGLKTDSIQDLSMQKLRKIDYRSAKQTNLKPVSFFKSQKSPAFDQKDADLYGANKITNLKGFQYKFIGDNHPLSYQNSTYTSTFETKKPPNQSKGAISAHKNNSTDSKIPQINAKFNIIPNEIKQNLQKQHQNSFSKPKQNKATQRNINVRPISGNKFKSKQKENISPKQAEPNTKNQLNQKNKHPSLINDEYNNQNNDQNQQIKLEQIGNIANKQQKNSFQGQDETLNKPQSKEPSNNFENRISKKESVKKPTEKELPEIRQYGRRTENGTYQMPSPLKFRSIEGQKDFFSRLAAEEIHNTKEFKRTKRKMKEKIHKQKHKRSQSMNSGSQIQSEDNLSQDMQEGDTLQHPAIESSKDPNKQQKYSRYKEENNFKQDHLKPNIRNSNQSQKSQSIPGKSQGILAKPSESKKIFKESKEKDTISIGKSKENKLLQDRQVKKQQNLPVKMSKLEKSIFKSKLLSKNSPFDEEKGFKDEEHRFTANQRNEDEEKQDEEKQQIPLYKKTSESNRNANANKEKQKILNKISNRKIEINNNKEENEKNDKTIPNTLQETKRLSHPLQIQKSGLLKKKQSNLQKNENKQLQDITANNQIKGFRVQPQILERPSSNGGNSKLNDLPSEDHRKSNQLSKDQLFNKSAGNFNKSKENRSSKPSIPRQSKEKDRNSKNHAQSVIQRKLREQKEKSAQQQKKKSKNLRNSKKNQGFQNDLDEDDTYGLMNKNSKSPTSQKKYNKQNANRDKKSPNENQNSFQGIEEESLQKQQTISRISSIKSLKGQNQNVNHDASVDFNNSLIKTLNLNLHKNSANKGTFNIEEEQEEELQSTKNKEFRPQKVDQQNKTQVNSSQNNIDGKNREIDEAMIQNDNKTEDDKALNENNYILKEIEEEEKEQNVKEASKQNQTANISINHTKIQKIDKQIGNYTRAPIISLIYDLPNEFKEEANKFIPSSKRNILKIEERVQQKLNNSLNTTIYHDLDTVSMALKIIKSIDKWIVERIFETHFDINNRVGVWLYCVGVWRLFLVEKENDQQYQTYLLQALAQAKDTYYKNQQITLEQTIKLITGHRVMKIKSNHKKLFKEIQYNLKKGHILKAFSKQSSNFKEKLFEVSKVQTTIKGQNVLQIKLNNHNDTHWIKQDKFHEIFDYFLLICNYPNSFWTNKCLKVEENSKAVYTINSLYTANGSITLYYDSETTSNVYLYKEIQSKVLKYVGKINQKVNKNGNLYFQFNLKGTYYVFFQCPIDAVVSVQGSQRMDISFAQYIKSQNLKNENCEYVQIAKIPKKNERKSGMNTEQAALQAMKKKFINYVTKK